MVDVRFPRPAMWLTTVTFTLAACGVGAPSLPIQVPVPSTAAEAPTGFDNRSNGTVDDSTHQADQDAFDEVEEIADGLGPLYNAQACRECHQNPTSGAASQITELRVGHLGPDGRFRNADIPIARGAVVISGRTLVNDRAICPNAAFPDSEIQERVPDTETIRTTRASLNLLGDGLVEAVADETLIELARAQRRTTRGTIRGQALYVPILEAPGETRIGRFGWKDQHASLLSFSADAYLNEMGITSRLLPDEVTTLCNTVSEPNNTTDSSGLADIDRFARFMRATKAPARGTVLAGIIRRDRLRHLSRSHSCHRRRRNRDQRRHRHHPARAGREGVSSLRRFPFAQCRHRRRDRHGDAGALWADRLQGPVEGVLDRPCRPHQQQDADGPVMGSAPAPAAHARRGVADITRRHRTASGRSERCVQAFWQADPERSGCHHRIPAVFVTALARREAECASSR